MMSEMPSRADLAKWVSVLKLMCIMQEPLKNLDNWFFSIKAQWIMKQWALRYCFPLEARQ